MCDVSTVLGQDQKPPQPSIYRTGSYPLASCKSWNGTVTELRETDTPHASIKGAVTESDFLEYCERHPGGDRNDPEDKEAVKACVVKHMQEQKSLLRHSLQLISTADCIKGLLQDTQEKAYQVVEPDSSRQGKILWRHIRSGELLDDSCASGTPPLTEQFKILCPARHASILAANTSDVPKNAAAVPSALGILPSFIYRKILTDENHCAERPETIPASAVTALDINGDKVADYIVSYEKICSTYCGTAGCRHDFWVSNGLRLSLVQAVNLQRIIRVERGRRGDTVLIDMHGTACDQAGDIPCTFRIGWSNQNRLATTLVTKTGVSDEEPWVGRWYTGDAKVCSGRRGESEGLLTYTATKAIGYESECRIVSKKRRGPATDIILACEGDGMVSRDRETLEVINGRLRRAVILERRPTTFTYSRCPQ